MSGLALIRGGGDLGTGVALALRAGGWRVVVHERARPTTLRLQVAFAYAAVRGNWAVGGLTAVRADTMPELRAALDSGPLPVRVGPPGELLEALRPDALIDARMQGLSERDLHPGMAPAVIALGPGWVAGEHCHAVIETHRGGRLGAVITAGGARSHTGIPGEVRGLTHERLLRAPAAGTLRRTVEIGAFVQAGEVVARVGSEPVRALITGMVRGLKLDGVRVGAGHKVGDVDPRRDRTLLREPTDKARAVGAGALRALETLRRARSLPSRPLDPSLRVSAAQ